MVDSFVWVPYGDARHEDASRLRYMDQILGYCKQRLTDAIEQYRTDKGDVPPHLEHVRTPFPLCT